MIWKNYSFDPLAAVDCWKEVSEMVFILIHAISYSMKSINYEMRIRPRRRQTRKFIWRKTLFGCS